MISRQNQAVEAEGEGYQAGRDLTVNKGMTSEQMTEIMVALAMQLQSYFAEAEIKAEARIKELRDSLLNEFLKPDTEGKKEAFTDPDYQYLLRDAHRSYARSGEETLREELVKLLIQRSAEPTGSRPALILNQAIAIAGNLTRQDYAALCGVFFFKHCSLGANDQEALIANFREIVKSFVQDLPTDNHAYDYLESLALVSMNRVLTFDFSQRLHQTYASVFAPSFLPTQLLEVAMDGGVVQKLGPSLIPILGQYGTVIRYKFDARNVFELKSKLEQVGIGEESKSRIIALFEQSLMPADQFEAMLIKQIPDLQRVQDTWNSTDLQHATLTALGKTMAHSALTSRSNFQAPLSIWVR